jgi:predicted RecB family nuclease
MVIDTEDMATITHRRRREVEQGREYLRRALQAKLRVKEVQDFSDEDLDLLSKNLEVRHFETATEALLLSALPNRAALVGTLMKAFKRGMLHFFDYLSLYSWRFDIIS